MLGEYPYPGLMGPDEIVGRYYLREGTRIVTKGRVSLYFDGYGNQRYRDSGTGRFISKEFFLEIVENTLHPSSSCQT